MIQEPTAHRTASTPVLPAAPLLVVMGVSGSGKSTVGALIAEGLGVDFIDADDLHPAANKDKMRRGEPLDDSDRWPWLTIVGQKLAESREVGLVVACSALRRSYRDFLRALAPDIVLVYLQGDKEFIRQRMSGRAHEFMPDSLLDSQFEVFEEPAADEETIAVSLAATPESIAREVLSHRG